MELAPLQLQIFFSLFVILAVAGLALICDFLKVKNEQLREAIIESNIRREEEQKRFHLLIPRTRPHALPAATSNVGAARPAQEMRRPMAMEPVAQRGGSTPRRQALRKDWSALLRRAKSPQEIEKLVVQIREDLAAVAVAAERAILARTSDKTLPAGFPSGFHDGYVLLQLVASHRPISGLVVSIGINAQREAGGSVPQKICSLVQSLLGPNDFAAQSSSDEFLLIYPQERGASAQRRLNWIAQQLWNFQLQSPGSVESLFSWGGLEVRDESIDEALASASERMRETRRTRKLLTMAS